MARDPPLAKFLGPKSTVAGEASAEAAAAGSVLGGWLAGSLRLAPAIRFLRIQRRMVEGGERDQSSSFTVLGMIFGFLVHFFPNKKVLSYHTKSRDARIFAIFAG